MSKSSNVSLETISLQKKYGAKTVLDDVSLKIYDGEFISILGHSGSGKSTLLRMLTGFVLPTSGEILVRGSDITVVPPHRRGIGLVFQDYALFPQMTVRQNVAFGLNANRTPRNEVKQRVNRMLEVVQLEDFAEQRPHQLSGGQQQRVALARVLVLEPDVVFFDEPFSSLDAQLRDRLRGELKEIHQRIGFSALFVTHDPREAMALSDRIAVLDSGKLAQLDTPLNIFNDPKTSAVAALTGSMNFFDGQLISRAGETATFSSGALKFTAHTQSETTTDDGVLLGVRPGNVHLKPAGEQTRPGTDNCFIGHVEQNEFLGDHSKVRIADGTGAKIEADVHISRTSTDALLLGAKVCATWEAEDVRVFPKGAHTPTNIINLRKELVMD